MPRLPEQLMARWPLLYPEITDADEQDADLLGEAERMKKEVIAPLRHTDDINSAFEEMSEEYSRWRNRMPPVEVDTESLLAREERIDHALTSLLEEGRDELGEQAGKVILESVRLRTIVSSSFIPNQETWPEGSWERIGHLMVSSELCIAGILQCLATGEGSRANVEELAKRGFQFALDAYFDAGEQGQDFTRLEDIPK